MARLVYHINDGYFKGETFTTDNTQEELEDLTSGATITMYNGVLNVSSRILRGVNYSRQPKKLVVTYGFSFTNIDDISLAKGYTDIRR